ncbi:MAG: GIY-YIG nuclease family protein [Leptolyngbya sp. PLA3]|nr:MAG: GIY-YIG nuclease family protein [Cyanobacteria bacterium CYA]MCE7969348.1 GIY-YIG nuclease family protein [Leptolyngbya sp. PL-A3]
MKPLGKTIQIYCPSGEPRGVRIAEITTRIVQAVVVPRAKLDEALTRPELSGVGLYFLFGASDTGALPVAYIGEAEDCGVRFKQHNKTKDFWNLGVAIVSRTGSFTKAHGKLLEWLAIEKASLAGRYQLDNGNAGGEPSVPEWMQSDVAEVFETAEVLLGTLGFPIFEPPANRSPDADRVFTCKRGGADARGVYNEEGFVVLKGSIARMELTSSSYDTVGPRREELIDAGVLVADKHGYRFERDMAFNTPSAAAAIVTGGSANGWVEWKNSRGQTLDDVYRKGPKE